MEIITAVIGLCSGFLLGWGMGLLRPRASQSPQEPELPEIPKRLKIQMDNFMTYDGTARGQKPIEE